MTGVLLFLIAAAALLHWAGNWRRVVGVTLVAVLAAGLVCPQTASAQFGLLGGIQNILDIIRGTVRSALDTIGAVSRTLDVMYQELVWPVRLIDQARSAVAGLIADFRAVMYSIYAWPVNSATLPSPERLETIIRNGQIDDFPALADSYYHAFGALPDPNNADPLVQNMIDIDDGLALNSLKQLKAADQAGEFVMAAGDRIEDEAQLAAPGSAPFLTASAMAANIQSQAMMQKMLATMLRQEAARIAHENALRKRHGLLVVKIRQSISDILQRP